MFTGRSQFKMRKTKDEHQKNIRSARDDRSISVNLINQLISLEIHNHILIFLIFSPFLVLRLSHFVFPFLKSASALLDGVLFIKYLCLLIDKEIVVTKMLFSKLSGSGK